MKQDEIIQIRVSPRFKEMLKKIADQRGLPLASYIKFNLMEALKTDPIWNQLETDQELRDKLSVFTKEL